MADVGLGRTYTGLTYEESRGLEQLLFDQYAGQLRNVIRPISPGNPRLYEYIFAGLDMI